MRRRSAKTYECFAKEADPTPITLADIGDLEKLTNHPYSPDGLLRSYLAYCRQRTEESRLVFAGNLYVLSRVQWMKKGSLFSSDWTSEFLYSIYAKVPKITDSLEKVCGEVTPDRLSAYVVPILRWLRRGAQQGRVKFVANDLTKHLPYGSMDFQHANAERVPTRVLIRDEIESIEDRVVSHCRVKERYLPAVRYLVRCEQQQRKPSVPALIAAYGLWRPEYRRFVMQHVSLLCRVLMESARMSLNNTCWSMSRVDNVRSLT